MEPLKLDDSEPTLVEAGDERCLINGKPPVVTIRLVQDVYYQKLLRDSKKLKANKENIPHRY